MNVLREVRKGRGLSQEELGYRTGIAQCRISLYELGQKGMSTRTALTLAEELNVPVRVFQPIIREVGRPRRVK